MRSSRNRERGVTTAQTLNGFSVELQIESNFEQLVSFIERGARTFTRLSHLKQRRACRVFFGVTACLQGAKYNEKFAEHRNAIKRFIIPTVDTLIVKLQTDFLFLFNFLISFIPRNKYYLDMDQWLHKTRHSKM